MKKLVVLVAVFLMAVVSLSAQLVVSMPNVPAEVTIWPGTTNVPLATFSLTNPNTTDAIFLNEMAFSFSGAFDQNTIANAKLMCNGLQISETSNDLISGDGFNEISLTILAGQAKEVTLVGDFSLNNQGRRISAGVSDSNQITAVNSSGAIMVVSGSFPMFGTLFLLLPSSISLYSAGPASGTIQITNEAIELYQCLIEPSGSDIVLQQINITHYGISGPDCASNLALYLNGSLIGNTWGFNPTTEEATFIMDNIILPSQINQLSVMGVLNPNLQTGHSICLGIQDQDIVAISPAGYICSMEYLSPSDFPVLGTTWWIENSVINPNNPLHTFIFNPISPADSLYNEYSIITEIPMLPRQSICFSSWIYPENQPSNCVSFTANLYANGLTVLPYSFMDGISPWGYQNGISVVNQIDYSPYGFYGTVNWMSNTTQGIQTTELAQFTVRNDQDSIGVKQVNGYVTTYDYIDGQFMPQSYCNLKTIYTEYGIIGDYDGNEVINDNDPIGLCNPVYASEVNPRYQPNEARGNVAQDWNSGFNRWIIHGFVFGGNPGFFGQFHIGEPFSYETNVPPANATFQQNANTLAIQTNGNLVGVCGKLPNGTNWETTIMINNNQLFRIDNDNPEPTFFGQYSRNEIVVNIPDGLMNVKVQGNVVDYSSMSTANDDPITPNITPTLNQNSPNPFNPETSIGYSLPKNGNVTIDIFNSRGQLIRTLVNETKIAGNYNIIWNGKDQSGQSVSSGIYFYKMKSGDYISTKKMVLMK